MNLVFQRAVAAGVALLVLAVAGSAALAPAAAGAEPSDRTVAVFEPRHRPAAELLPLARAGLGERGQAVLDVGTNALVLVGSKGSLAETVELLRQMDRRPRTLVLRYESQRTDSLEARGIQVDWSVGSGGSRVGNVRFPPGEDGVRLSGYAIGTDREGGLSGVLRILEGRSGRIVTGRSVPVTRRSLWDVDVTWATAESGFEARPRILADGRVHVELLPMEAEVGERGRIRFTEAATAVTLAPGETVAVGGIDRSNQVQRQGTRVYEASQRSQQERVLLLSVEVEEAAEEARPARALP